jgi:hypothetical protein
MWQNDARGLGKCDLGLPSHLLSPKQQATAAAATMTMTTTTTVRELSDRTSYNKTNSITKSEHFST